MIKITFPFLFIMGKRTNDGWRNNGSKSRVFDLLSYLPELNPNKYLKGNFKNKVHSGESAPNRKDLEKKTRSFKRTLLKRPTHVRSYFKHHKVAYATLQN